MSRSNNPFTKFRHIVGVRLCDYKSVHGQEVMAAKRVGKELREALGNDVINAYVSASKTKDQSPMIAVVRALMARGMELGEARAWVADIVHQFEPTQCK